MEKWHDKQCGQTASRLYWSRSPDLAEHSSHDTAATTHFSSDMNKLVSYATRLPCTVYSLCAAESKAGCTTPSSCSAGRKQYSKPDCSSWPHGSGDYRQKRITQQAKSRANIRTKTRTSAGDRFPNTLEDVFVHQKNPLGSGLGGHRPGLDVTAKRQITSQQERSPEHPAHTRWLT